MSAFPKPRKHLLLASTLAAVMAATATSTLAAQDEVRVREERGQGGATPSRPRQGAESRSVIVRYPDLDVTAAPGVNALYQRLKTAARSVCSPAVHRDLASYRDWSRCYSGALDKAVSDTGSRPVAAIHQEFTGRQIAIQVASAR